jgi:hypothetical protein
MPLRATSEKRWQTHGHLVGLGDDVLCVAATLIGGHVLAYLDIGDGRVDVDDDAGSLLTEREWQRDRVQAAHLEREPEGSGSDADTSEGVRCDQRTL